VERTISYLKPQSGMKHVRIQILSSILGSGKHVSVQESFKHTNAKRVSALSSERKKRPETSASVQKETWGTLTCEHDTFERDFDSETARRGP